MKAQMLRGSLEPLALIDVLAYVARLRETGVLKVAAGDVQKSVVIHKGNIVFARSNRQEDRLGDMLLMQGRISAEQYDQASTLLREKGYRHGRSLVEIGAITPKTLWQAIQDQVKNIAYSVIPWQEGSFEFTQQEIKAREQITLELPVMDLVVDVIRHFDRRSIFRSKFSVEEFYEVDENADFEIAKLEPYEDYVLKRVDGLSTVQEICERSDVGCEETARTLYLLRSLGWIRLKVQPGGENPYLALITRYNKMFSHLNQYLTRHLGTVGTSLMRKYLEETRQIHSAILGEIEMAMSGMLDAQKLHANLDALGFESEAGHMALEDALGEFLYACILAVKKALGTEHETRVVQELETYQ